MVMQGVMSIGLHTGHGSAGGVMVMQGVMSIGLHRGHIYDGLEVPFGFLRLRCQG